VLAQTGDFKHVDVSPIRTPFRSMGFAGIYPRTDRALNFMRPKGGLDIKSAGFEADC
jgi:hypothetical protein